MSQQAPLRTFQIVGVKTLPGSKFLDGAVLAVAHGGITEEVVLSYAELLELMQSYNVRIPEGLLNQSFSDMCDNAAHGINRLLVEDRYMICGLTYPSRDPEDAVHFEAVYHAIAGALSMNQAAPDLRLFERELIFQAMGHLLGFSADEDRVENLLRGITQRNPTLKVVRRDHDRFREVCTPRIVRFVILRGPWPFDQEVWYVALVLSGTQPVLIEKARGWLK